MDQVPEDLALAPDSPRRPERSRVGVGIWVGRGESRALAVRGLERCQDALVDGGVAIETESECVCGEIRILVVVRELEALDHVQVVFGKGALRLRPYRGGVGRPGPGVDRPWGRIVEPDRVVGDAEHV